MFFRQDRIDENYFVMPGSTYAEYWSKRTTEPWSVRETPFWQVRNAEREEFISSVLRSETQENRDRSVHAIMEWDRYHAPSTTPRQQLKELGFVPATPNNDWADHARVTSFLDFYWFYNTFATHIMVEYPNSAPARLTLDSFERLSKDNQNAVLDVLFKTLDDVIPDIVPRTGEDENAIGSYIEYIVVRIPTKPDSLLDTPREYKLDTPREGWKVDV